ncbi:MAG: hypothetical protein HQM07_04750 [Zetaproteobacteria bacterium]|nr:hypothetical protein [Zetaproteobacteria bacterium]
MSERESITATMLHEANYELILNLESTLRTIQRRFESTVAQNIQLQHSQQNLQNTLVEKDLEISQLSQQVSQLIEKNNNAQSKLDFALTYIERLILEAEQEANDTIDKV